MAQTKIKLIADGVIDVNNLAAGHTITTDNIGEGSNLYYTDARVASYLTTNSYATESFVTTGYLPLSGGNITGNFTVDTNTLYVDATNNRIGIGTTSPNTLLDVNGEVRISPTTPPSLQILRNANIGNTASTGFIAFGGKDTSDYVAGATIVTIAEGDWSTTSHPTRMSFATTPTGGSAAIERLRITSSGNIGIGTTSPSTILNVNTDVNNNGITLSGTNGNLRFNIKNNQVTSGQRAFSMMMSGSYPALIFQGLDDNYGFIRNIMAIEHSGDIGIGTITPSSIFHLKQDAPVLTSESTNTVSGFRINVLGGNSQLLRVQKEGTTKFQIDPNGAVYLGGSTAAANALDDYEEGTWGYSMSPSSSGSITINGNVDRGSYTKIGRVVTITGLIEVLSVSSPVGTYVTLSTLPFPISARFGDYETRIGGSVILGGTTTGLLYAPFFGIEGQSSIRILFDQSIIQSGTQFYLSFSYIA